MRLFAAVLPPAPALDHLETALVSVCGATDPGDARGPLRWTVPEDRHLTLAFYGEVPEGYLGELSRDLDAVAAGTGPFTLALRGAGVFDGRTVWVGCSEDTATLTRLMADAVAVGRDLLGRSDERVRSRAHLTVARVRARAAGPGRPRTGRGPAGAQAAAVAHALAVYQGPSWTVDEIALMASALGGGQGGSPRYVVVHRTALRAVAG